MPANLTYPGVYIEEIPSGVRTIVGVATSITAFIGRAKRGPVNAYTLINNYGDFERIFGGLWLESRLGYAVRDFYMNGGSQAIIVRVTGPNAPSDIAEATALDTVKKLLTDAGAAANGKDAKDAAQAVVDNITDDFTKNIINNIIAPINALGDADDADAVKKAIADAQSQLGTSMALRAWVNLGTGADVLKLKAISPGKWGDQLKARVDDNSYKSDAELPPNYKSVGLKKDDLFNLSVFDAGTGASEYHRNLSVKPGPRQVNEVLKNESNLVRTGGDLPTNRPSANDVTAKAKATEAVTAAKKARTDLEATGTATDEQKKDAEDAVKATEDAVKTLDKRIAGKVVSPTDTADAARWITVDETMKGSDGIGLTSNDFVGDGMAGEHGGLYALDKADLFNLLYIPPYKNLDNGNGGDIDYGGDLIAAAVQYCEKRRAMFLSDTPSTWTDKDKARDGMTADNVGTTSKNAAIFFPRFKQQNPLRDGQIDTFGVGGAVAGVCARTDATRGVWKAPAGVDDGTLLGVPQLSVKLTDEENGELNPLGLNCFRVFPVYGRVIWGSRTANGADVRGSEWKYLPVRRTALFIEESLYRGTKWVVFEPNDERTWAAIRLNVGAFMHGLFKKGAFQKKTSNARDSYFVKCDAETTTQNDINLGIVNIVVGFAPLKPIEFVVIKIQQIVGDIQT